jgi:hypothetical protein
VIETHYVDGAPIPHYDRQLTQMLEARAIEDDGMPMVVAVENPEGAMYRLIRCHGIGAYMHVTQELLAMGFDDVFADIPGRNGIDSYFVPTAAVGWVGDPAEVTRRDPATDILANIKP